MINEHAEFKDVCQELETRIEEIANDIQGFPTDYKPVSYTHLTLPTILRV